MTWPYRIPLWGKGRAVAGWALVDPEDFWELYGFRWHLLKGYANRTAPRDDGSMLNTQIAMHRQVLRLKRDAGTVDHVNRDRLDNRRANLRLSTRAQNMHNLSPRADGTSKYRGVHWNRSAGKWVAQVVLNGKTYRLGAFVNEEEAGTAAQVFRLEHMSHATD